MNDFSQIAEFSVQKKRSYAFKICKILFPILSCLLSVFISLMIPGILGTLFLIFAVAFSLCYCHHYFRTVHYDYRIVSNELFFSAVYNRKRRKELGFLNISKLEAIAPYDEKHKELAERVSYDKIYDFSSSLNDPYVYYAIYNDEEKGEKSIFFFNVSEKMLRLLKLYNRKTVSVSFDEE